MAQTVKRLPTMWETQVQSLGWEDLLEKEMATHSSILAWKIPWTEKLLGSFCSWRLQSMGLQESDTTEQLHFHFHFITSATWKALDEPKGQKYLWLRLQVLLLCW